MGNQKNVFKNIRYYATEQEKQHLTLRSQHEQNPSYNALKDDITVVNFYFDEPDVIQYLKYLRMTPIDFISKVGGIWGLFCGVSLASILELLYWATVRFYRNF